MRRTLISIAGLVVLLFLLDQLYRVLHPQVNLVRATLVGASGGLVLAALWRVGLRRIPPVAGGLAIFASAFLSVLAIEAGWLVSRSLLSAVVHVAILAAAFPVLEGLLAARGAGGRPMERGLR